MKDPVAVITEFITWEMGYDEEDGPRDVAKALCAALRGEGWYLVRNEVD